MRSATRSPIRVAVVESDPLRFVGFHALFEDDSEFELKSCSPSSIFNTRAYEVVLITARADGAMYDIMAGLKAINPSVRIITTGSSPNDEMAIRALKAGAKGYIEESSPAEEFKQAIRTVNDGSVWASRHIISKFIERVTTSPAPNRVDRPLVFSDREREVLRLLISGRSNREIGFALGIEERTVKAHVANLMRKTGVNNRIALSVHALTHSMLGVNQAE